jgi:hypothetical protein
VYSEWEQRLLTFKSNADVQTVNDSLLETKFLNGKGGGNVYVSQFKFRICVSDKLFGSNTAAIIGDIVLRKKKGEGERKRLLALSYPTLYKPKSGEQRHPTWHPLYPDGLCLSPHNPPNRATLKKDGCSMGFFG